MKSWKCLFYTTQKYADFEHASGYFSSNGNKMELNCLEKMIWSPLLPGDTTDSLAQASDLILPSPPSLQPPSAVLLLLLTCLPHCQLSCQPMGHGFSGTPLLPFAICLGPSFPLSLGAWWTPGPNPETLMSSPRRGSGRRKICVTTCGCNVVKLFRKCNLADRKSVV